MADAGAVQTAENKTDAGAAHGDPSTHFAFKHRVFNTPGAVFTYDRRNRDVHLNIKMGEMDAKVNIESLCNEFNIRADSEDGRLLETLKSGIVFVKQIRPGDKIPTELLDGSASWSIDSSHAETAKMKLMAATLDWLDGGAGGSLRQRLDALAKDPSLQKRVNEGFGRIARELNLGAEGKEKVIQRFERLAHELGFIEALRAHFTQVVQVHKTLKMLVPIYAKDHQISESVRRMIALIEGPIDSFREAFQQVDGHTEDIKSAMRNIDAEIEFVREIRDQLHLDSMVWDEVLSVWGKLAPERSSVIEAELKTLYQFLAQNFSIEHRWGS